MKDTHQEQESLLNQLPNIKADKKSEEEFYAYVFAEKSDTPVRRKLEKNFFETLLSEQ